MRVGIRIKQVLGVLAIVSLAVVVQGGFYLASLTKILLENNRAQATLVKDAIYQRIFAIAERGGDTSAEIGADEGLKSTLESVAYSDVLVRAVICDVDGFVLADPDAIRPGKCLDPAPDLNDLIDNQNVLAHLHAIYTPGTYELREPLKLGTTEFGSIRVRVSTLLLRSKLEEQMLWPFIPTLIAILVGSLVAALLLARLTLRPIHMIRGGLAKLGRGEVDVSVDLPDDTEFTDLGASFKQLTARLAADRTDRAGHRALESVVDRLEDAVALFGTDGTLRFANAAMRNALGLAADSGSTPAEPRLTELFDQDHPYRRVVERALADGTTQAAPMQVPEAGERLVLTNVVPGASGEPMGVLLVSRNLAYISQVESTLSYSRKLSALNRLTAGIAHEIKNPLNATMIHLELLKMQVSDREDAMASAAVIADQVRRLDEVVQGFLKFSRPEDLHLEAVDLAAVMDRLRPVLDAEAATHKIDVRIDVPVDLPPVEGDANLLEQAFLNLGLNACQAMPDGGRLTITARPETGQLISISVEDTGVGIEAENLSRIFDLYFTTKPHGSGIGLSLVFRTIQLHNGEIEVQSVPGRGTTFRVLLRARA